MRKQLAGLISSLAFVVACEDATAPETTASKATPPDGGTSGGNCPQIVEFDSETGQITILDENLSRRLREFYGVMPGTNGSGQAVVVFVGGAAKTGGDDAIQGVDTVVNLRC